MLTIKAEIKRGERRKDGTFNVKIRFTLNRKIKRVSTSIFVRASDLDRDGRIKRSSPAFKEAERLVMTYQIRSQEMQVDTLNCPLDIIVGRIVNPQRRKRIDFIRFSREWIATAPIKGTMNYTSAVNSFVRFLGRDSLDIRDLTVRLLREYTEFLQEEGRKRAEETHGKGTRVPTRRSVSLYLGCIRHLYNEAQMRYNDYENNSIVVPNMLFKVFKVPKQQPSRKRAITKEQLLAIFNLPYKEVVLRRKDFIRFNLAKDTFILSFCLMGINSADLFEAATLKGSILIYERAKTRDRRDDSARMEVEIPPIAMSIARKYKDLTGKKVFNFYQHYSDRRSFNRAINLGLKEVGRIIGVEDLEFYAARHTWATLAVNEAGIDKYTVHSALNHLDTNMRVTDIYIRRNFSVENRANRKVVEYVFGREGQE